MNKLITVLVLSFITVTTSAQHIADETKQWNLRFNYFANLTTEVFRFDGDTIFDGKVYYKLMCSYDSMATWSYMGGVREENAKVFYRHPDYAEGLLYDFDITTGDTVHVQNYFSGGQDIPILVTATDTIMTLDRPRKRWHLETLDNSHFGVSPLTDAWIEGIGSLQGPIHGFFTYCIICPYWELQCYYENDTLTYTMPSMTTCFDVGSGIEEQTGVRIFYLNPNPVSRGEHVRVRGIKGIVTASIYDLSGKKEIQKIHTGGVDDFIIMTVDLVPGLHIIKLASEDGTVYTGKIVVQ